MIPYPCPKELSHFQLVTYNTQLQFQNNNKNNNLSFYFSFARRKLSYHIAFAVLFCSLISFFASVKCEEEINCVKLWPDNNRIHCNAAISGKLDSQNIFCQPEKEIVQIVGEYDVLQINCSSEIPLDFDFDGIQPSEAIHLDFSKTISLSPSNPELRTVVAYNIHIRVYSNQALFNYYYPSKNDNVHDDDADAHGENNNIIKSYSRTGIYRIRGVFDKSANFSVYFFLEDPLSQMSFLSNGNTVLPKRTNDEHIILPCRTTHLNQTVKLLAENGTEIVQNVNYEPTQGIIIKSEQMDKILTCSCQISMIPDSNSQVNNTEDHPVSIQYNLSQLNKPISEELHSYYGFENLKQDKSINLNHGVNALSPGHFLVEFTCTFNIDSAQEADSLYLAVIEATSPTHSRIVQEFVSPRFWNRSYSIMYGKRASPPGVVNFKDGKLAGLVACGSPDTFKIKEYATGFDKLVRVFPYTTNWSAFDISGSPPRNHIMIIPPTQDLAANGFFYTNTTYEFKCWLRTHGLAPPLVWYKKTKTGEIVSLHEDHNLDSSSISTIKLFLTSDIKELIATASFWDRDLWKNKTFEINQIQGKAPIITNTTQGVKALPGSLVVLKCEAKGDPLPRLSWIKENEELSSSIAGESIGSSILELPEISESNIGNYLCLAQNIHGNASKWVRVEFTSESLASSTNYGIVIGIPLTLTFLIIIGNLIYLRFCRKQYTGLTYEEIEDFIKGKPELWAKCEKDSVQDDISVIPYDKGYELSHSDYQISYSEELGSGAFGIVYKGIVKGCPAAVKTLKEGVDKDYLKGLLGEIKIMIYLGNHDYIVQLLGADTSDLRKGNVYIFVEYCPMGNLEKYLRKKRPTFRANYANLSKFVGDERELTLNDLYVMAYQVAKGMEYLASKKVIHGDLATRNILLTSERNIKITDFGLSRKLYNYASYVKKNQEPLPWRWMAIESLKDLVFSTHSDVWSYGILLWEIFTLAEVPYPGLVWDLDFVNKLDDGLRMLQPRYASVELYQEVILSCWDVDPERRPPFHDIARKVFQMLPCVKSSGLGESQPRSSTGSGYCQLANNTCVIYEAET